MAPASLAPKQDHQPRSESSSPSSRTCTSEEKRFAGDIVIRNSAFAFCGRTNERYQGERDDDNGGRRMYFWRRGEERERTHSKGPMSEERERKERRDAVVPLPPSLPSDRRVWQSRRFSRRVRSVKRSSPVPLPSPFVRDPSANGIRQ